MTEHYCAHHVPMFQSLSQDHLNKINNAVIHTTYQKGEQLSSPYNSVGLFIIYKGQVKEYQLSISGKEQLLRLIGPGEMVGEQTLFSDEEPQTYIEAISPLSVCLLRREDFKEIIFESPMIAMEMLSELNQRLKETEKQTMRIATESVRSRLASFLLDLVEAQESTSFELPFSMKELASYLATTPETISRRLKEMEEEGYIQRQGRQINVNDLDAFSNYVFNLKEDPL